MTKENKQEKVQGLLLDLDGVFYIGDKLLDGAVDAVHMLRRREIPHCFITNTTTSSRSELVSKLQRLGLPVQAESILSAPQAARQYMISRNITSVHLLVRDNVREDFSEFITDSSEAEAVVLGDLGDQWNYEILNTAFAHLMAGAELIALHRNRFWQSKHGLSLDIGAFVTGLEYAADTRAVVVGKPSMAFFQQAADKLGIPCSGLAIVGDDIESDVGGGQKAGLRGILVRTGKYRKEFSEQCGIRPDVELGSIADIMDLPLLP
jgi:HAD superfamily hydrolase (TIGR01458 family)